ncbi:MAG: aminoacyl-tRNA hydrolase [Patescibacteria group bacterium]|nr:aminoacyl-tRNA hydrolase [Patescibacteria group bacterium]
MKLLVGLGNPGKKYENTRHNTGFIVLENFRKEHFPAEKWKFEKKFNSEIILIKDYPCFKETPLKKVSPLLLMKPLTLMNNSGDAVVKVSQYYKIAPRDVTVIHDDLDIPLGESRLQKGRGAAGHHGVASIIAALGTKDFCRLRVGIDSPLRKKVNDDANFVLKNFSAKEQKALKEFPRQLAERLFCLCSRDLYGRLFNWRGQASPLHP